MTAREIVIQRRVDQIWWRCCTYRLLEHAAGITDRNEFWKGKTADEAVAELRRLIEERVRRGELADI